MTLDGQVKEGARRPDRDELDELEDRAEVEQVMTCFRLRRGASVCGQLGVRVARCGKHLRVKRATVARVQSSTKIEA